MSRALPTVALVLSDHDHVGVVLNDVDEGDVVEFRSSEGKTYGDIRARNNIPFGHKIAREARQRGEQLIRYGQPIGNVTADLVPGDHVHTHNLISLLSAQPVVDRDRTVLRPAGWIRQLILSLLERSAVPAPAREAMAEALIEANLRGIDTHGVSRLVSYLDRIRSGGVNAQAQPEIQVRGATVLIDGNNGVGHYVATVAADAVSAAATQHGVGVALVRNSNHFGFAGYYATRIAQRSQIGIVASNGQVCVTPLGAMRPIFANDPLAVAAPIDQRRFLEMDMATSVTSRAKIVLAAQAAQRIPLGQAVDKSGMETDLAAAALEGGLLPLGGIKGFALLFAVEVLTGVLTGGSYADQVSSKEAAPAKPEGTCHFMIAIDIERVMDTRQFCDRLSDLVKRVKSLPLRPNAGQLRFPGELRWQNRAERLEHGIPLGGRDYDALIALAKQYAVPLPA